MKPKSKRKDKSWRIWRNVKGVKGEIKEEHGNVKKD
jgi:hypothetical protein